MEKINIKIGIIGLLLGLTSCMIKVKPFKVDHFKTGVTTSKARGTIFNDNYPFKLFYVSDVDSTKRWTPNQAEIELAEKILWQQIKEINKNRPNQMASCPVIHRHLNSYFRQYVGIKNEKGQKIIHINFYWDKFGLWDRIRGYYDSRLDYDSDYTIVFDGCSHYWHINVNLDENKLSDFAVNGVA